MSNTSLGSIVKPHQGLRINWDDPSTRGLVFAHAGSLANQQDLVSGNQGTLITSGNWGGGFTDMGQSLESTSDTTGGAFWTPDSRVYDITNKYTLIGWAKASSYAGDGFFIQVQPRDTDGSPFISMGVGKGSTGSGMRAFKTVTGTLHTLFTSASGLVVADDILHQFAITENVGGVVRFYKDGVFIETGNITAGDIDFVDESSVVTQNRHSTGVTNGYTGESPLGQIYNRVLSDEEIRERYINPWQFVKPVIEGKSFFIPINIPPLASNNLFRGNQ